MSSPSTTSWGICARYPLRMVALRTAVVSDHHAGLKRTVAELGRRRLLPGAALVLRPPRWHSRTFRRGTTGYRTRSSGQGDGLNIRPPCRAIGWKHCGATVPVRHSIRINAQWRICFRWTDDGPCDVEIVDYH